MLKKLSAVLLALSLCLGLCAPALAASKPSLHVKSSTVKLHPGESFEVELTIRNPGDTTFAALPDPAKITVSKKDIIAEPVFEADLVGKNETKITLITGTKEGKTTLKIPFDLSNGKKLTLTLTVHVAENFAPTMNWHHILIDEKTGYPEIKLSMSDDFGLRNVCFVREWTDEQGVAQREIYDIYSLNQALTAVRYRTLRVPGAYSLQINDGTKQRFNSKVLVTVLDTDGDGVVDAYYTDDPAVVTSFTVSASSRVSPESV